MLLGVLECLYRFAGTPSGQSKLAREAGLANNTVAASLWSAPVALKRTMSRA